MNPSLITSAEPSTENQRKQCVRVVADATAKATQAQLDKLHTDGILTKANMQQILAAGGKFGAAAAEAVRAKILTVATGRVGCLQRIFADREFEVGPTNGTETLASASDLFGSHIHPDFNNWKCDQQTKPTKLRMSEVYEMCKKGNYRRIFGGFGLNLDLLCWETPEIKSWLARHASSTLREDGWAFFLFLFKKKAEKPEDKGEYFVADVGWNAGGYRYAGVNRFSNEDVWNAENRCRVVVPQQALVI